MVPTRAGVAGSFNEMAKLGPKDRFAIEASSGWLMLNNAAEAMAELGGVSAGARERPEVLLAWWDIHAHCRQWEQAVQTADQLIAQVRDRPDGYIKRAFALHELKRTQDAWDTLHPMSERFGENWLIPYNLACYASQLGRPGEAVNWFRRALRAGDARELRSMALSDPDLEPIRETINKLTAR